jgi:hypothetical protein
LYGVSYHSRFIPRKFNSGNTPQPASDCAPLAQNSHNLLKQNGETPRNASSEERLKSACVDVLLDIFEISPSHAVSFNLAILRVWPRFPEV